MMKKGMKQIEKITREKKDQRIIQGKEKKTLKDRKRN
jgi:hypothetical protein